MRQKVKRLADGRCGEGGKGGRAIGRVQTICHGGGKIEAVERFRVGCGQIWMLQKAFEPCFVHFARSAERAVPIHLSKTKPLDEIVEWRIGRPGVEGDHKFLAIPPGYIADATKIEDRGVAAAIDFS
ncbi:hypothetical protein D3C73_983620 [compost metagenome]